jgi:hypothetical protein
VCDDKWEVEGFILVMPKARSFASIASRFFPKNLTMKALFQSAAAIVVIHFSLCLASPAGAQQGGYYVPPGGAPLSPYLDLFRRDVGLLNQYYNFIVPRRQLANTLNQQGAALNVLQNQVQDVRGGLRPVQTAPIGRTGVGAGYMNYSHYYPGMGRP